MGMRKLLLVVPIIGLALFGARSLASSGHASQNDTRTDQRIEAVARQIAREMGDHPVTKVVYVATRRLAANRAAGGDIVDSNELVYLVAVRGRFIDFRASPPFGAALPRGTVLTLVLTRSGLRVTDLGVGDRWPKLAGLGPVHVITQAAAARQ